MLTNDGDLARKMELPSTGWVRRYRVRVHGTPDLSQLASLERGITVEGVAYGPIKALLDRQQGSNAWLTVSLKEGKNREIRKVMEHLGWTVSRLIRIAYGPFQLGLLEPGAADEVPTRVIKEQLGDKGANKAPGSAGSPSAESPAASSMPARLKSAKPKDVRPSHGPSTPSRSRTKPHADRRRPS
jgi:23S rRNA pseudouridine2605 synthase